MNEIPSSSTKQEEDDKKKDANLQNKFAVHFMISFYDMCMVTAALPLLTMSLCFVTAYVFQAEEVHETHCRVYNVIPSISAITGVSPQRYFWRICIALHVAPRFPIAVMYRNYYQNRLHNLKTSTAIIKRINILINVVFWLNIIEVASLCGVTYISNRENYPVHEKIFITFMVVSLCHMLATIKLYELLHEEKVITEKQQFSLKWKKILFAVSIGGTVGLILFFLKHRLLCQEMAFSWFALCEYIIASANMCFHCTTIWDFPNEYLVILQNPNPDKLKEYLRPIDRKIE